MSSLSGDDRWNLGPGILPAEHRLVRRREMWAVLDYARWIESTK